IWPPTKQPIEPAPATTILGGGDGTAAPGGRDRRIVGPAPITIGGTPPREARRDYRPPPQQLPLAARALVARGARRSVRDPEVPARREDDARAAGAAQGASARQVAGDHRRRQYGGRIGGDHRVPAGALRRRPPRAREGHAGAAALHLLAALRRGLGDGALADEAGVRPDRNLADAVLRQAVRPRHLAQGQDGDGRAEPEAPSRPHGTRAD